MIAANLKVVSSCDEKRFGALLVQLRCEHGSKRYTLLGQDGIEGVVVKGAADIVEHNDLLEPPKLQ